MRSSIRHLVLCACLGTASLVAHLLEEQSRPIGFVLSHAGSKAIDYDGPVPPGFVAGGQ